MGSRTSLAGNDAIERRCQALETKTRLDLDAVDRAIARIRRPEVVRARLGDALLYAQRVEAEVAQLPIDVALPHTADSFLGRFLRVWTPDEIGHGEAQERLLGFLGMPAPEAVTDDWLMSHIAGLLGRVSPQAYAMISMTYHTVGAMNEKLAMSAYQAMATIASEVGEQELADVLFSPMRRDESMHLGFYRTYAGALGRQLRPWQRRAVRNLIVSTYAPVGARRDKHKPSLGRTLLALEHDPDDPTIATLTQAIAEDLLAESGQVLPPFVHRAMGRCVESARASDVGEHPPPETVALAR